MTTTNPYIVLIRLTDLLVRVTPFKANLGYNNASDASSLKESQIEKKEQASRLDQSFSQRSTLS